MAPRTSQRRRWEIKNADCLLVLPKLEAASVDALITDPPYEIGIVGMHWDRL
jgi:site-specific DNA-methyltransferase (adenine-specific)